MKSGKKHTTDAFGADSSSKNLFADDEGSLKQPRSEVVGRMVNFFHPMSKEQADSIRNNKKYRKAHGYGRALSFDTHMTTGETDKAYDKRNKRNQSRLSFSSGATRQTTTARIILIVIVCIIVAAAAVGGAFFGFYISLSNNLSGAEVGDALVEQTENKPYYVLFAADLDKYNGSNDDLDAMILARVDESAKSATLILLPPNLQVQLSDKKAHPATDAMTNGGDAELIRAVSDFLGVDISHFMRTDYDGLAAIIDDLGGLHMTIEEDIDDPLAGYVYIPAGEQYLTGEEAIEVLRASNFHSGIDQKYENQCLLARALAAAIFSYEGSAQAFLIDSLAGNISTDWNAFDVLSVASALQGMTEDDIMYCTAPGYESTYQDVTSFILYDDDWDEILELVEAGENPNKEEQKDVKVDPKSVSITVRNGCGVAGGAAMIAELLEKRGYDIVEVGNADSYVYTQTFVIYDDEDNLYAAQAVLEDLGQGRVLNGLYKYAFETDILVILGSDWK